jgi:hypothetical protein
MGGLASAGLAESGSPSISYRRRRIQVFKYINLKHMTCLTEKDAESSMAYSCLLTLFDRLT